MAHTIQINSLLIVDGAIPSVINNFGEPNVFVTRFPSKTGGLCFQKLKTADFRTFVSSRHLAIASLINFRLTLMQ